MSTEKPLSAILNEMLHTYELKDKTDEVRLKSNWEQIVGGVIARRTDKMYIRDNTLHIWLSSAPLKQELTYHRAVVLERIQSMLGSNTIKDLKIY